LENKVIVGEIKGDFCDCGNDFNALSISEKQRILKTAKTLLREQNKVKSLLANAGNDPLPMELERRKRL